MKKIALEEHFLIPELEKYIEETYQNINANLASKAVPSLLEIDGKRLETMEQCGIDFSVLSIAGPGVQIEENRALASHLAKKANDDLANIMASHTGKFGGMAHLAMQNPEQAADELERCITELGFQGAMINGQTLGIYLDNPVNEVFWERAAALKAPVYIHPGNPTAKHVTYEGYEGLWGPFWSWGVETATHALRLMLSGVFERHQDARIILGHMGEMLPYFMWRFDSRLAISRHSEPTLSHAPSHYLKNNVFCTTSGVSDLAPLRCAMENLGENNIMFSTDYPFENAKEASDWIEGVDITYEQKEKICALNAMELLCNMS